MKYLNGEYYVEAKDHRYKNHPTENIILRKRDPPKTLRTQYQVQNDTQIRRNQKVIKNDNDQLVVKNYPKNKQPIIQKQIFNHQIVLFVNQVLGYNLINVFIVKIANTLSTNRNIR